MLLAIELAFREIARRSLLRLALGGNASATSPAIDRTAWHAGVNALSLQFACATRPMDVGLGGDPRPLSAAIDWIRVSVPDDTAR